MADRDGATVRFPPPLVFVFSLWLGFGLNRVLPLPQIPLERNVRIAIGAAVSLAIVHWMAVRPEEAYLSRNSATRTCSTSRE